MLIYALYALVSLLSLFIVAVLVFGFRIHGSLLQFFLGWLLVLISMFSIGIMVGGIAKNVKIAGIIGSLLYFPMLVFSGATLPYEVMPTAMQKISDILVLTQGIKILKAAILGQPVGNILIPIVVMAAVGVICTTVALKYFKWE